MLKSSDGGSTWTAHGAISLPNTWLVEPAVEVGSKGQLLMLFRTAAGEGQAGWCRGVDGWSRQTSKFRLSWSMR